MDERISKANEHIRIEFSNLWKKGAFKQIADIIAKSLKIFSSSGLVPSIEINIAYGPALGEKKRRSVHPLCYITPSFSVTESKEAELKKIIEDKNLTAAEKADAVQKISKEGSRLHGIEFSLLRLDEKIKTCEKCQGAGYLSQE